MSAAPNHDPPVRVGVFRRLAAADRAVEKLVAEGFPKERISVICPTCSEDALPDGVKVQSPAGEDMPPAVAAGGTIGAVLGGLTACVGLAATGGIGVLAVGPLVGATGTGAVAGGFLGAMATRGVEPEIADFYDQELTRGHVLVAVDTAPEAPGVPSARRAEAVFEEAGADPIPLRRG